MHNDAFMIAFLSWGNKILEIWGNWRSHLLSKYVTTLWHQRERQERLTQCPIYNFKYIQICQTRNPQTRKRTRPKHSWNRAPQNSDLRMPFSAACTERANSPKQPSRAYHWSEYRCAETTTNQKRREIPRANQSSHFGANTISRLWRLALLLIAFLRSDSTKT